MGPAGAHRSQLDTAVAAQLGARAIAASLRVVLIRRHGRNPRGPRRSWALVDSTPGRETIAWGSFTAETELLDLPLDGERRRRLIRRVLPRVHTGATTRAAPCGAGPSGPRSPGRARQPRGSGSHVGGDRFAPNVVVLPQGLYYGRVSAAGAASIVEAHERSEVVVEHLRGRAAFRPAVQAANTLRAGSSASPRSTICPRSGRPPNLTGASPSASAMAPQRSRRPCDRAWVSRPGS